MTNEELIECFENNEDLPLDIKQVSEQAYLGDRRDLLAMLILDRLMEMMGDERNIIACADHDKIYFNIRLDTCDSSVWSEDDVKDLIRCGVFVDDEDYYLGLYY